MNSIRSLLRRWFPYLEDSALFFLSMVPLFGGTVLVCVLLTGCGSGSTQEAKDNPLYQVSTNSSVYVMEYIDPKTGVRYLIVSKSGSSAANPASGVAIIRADLPAQNVEAK